VELAVSDGTFAQSDTCRHPHVRGDVGPTHTRPHHAVAGGGIEQKDPQEAKPQGFIVESADHRLAYLCLARSGGNLGAQLEEGCLSASRVILGSMERSGGLWG
jgi:hypothetical protein